jgi:hypothetical protein
MAIMHNSYVTIYIDYTHAKNMPYVVCSIYFCYLMIA